MNTTLVMTLIGADRPGLVGRLATVIADHGGNWLESRMAHMGGHFAGILRVEISADRGQQLVVALETLEADGLSVRVHSGVAAPADGSGLLANLEVVGADRPGIVRQISRVLGELHVNVEELVTEREHGAMSGESIFRATASVRLPAAVSVAALRQALERIASDLMVDVAVMPAR